VAEYLYRFEREARTPYSESYAIESDEHSLGRVDLHFTSSVAYATLAVHDSLDEEAVQRLIAEIDERLVTSADPYREDFIVTVWRGREVGTFADEPDFDDDDASGDAPASP
jgi:hypothetical protein